MDKYYVIEYQKYNYIPQLYCSNNKSCVEDMQKIVDVNEKLVVKNGKD